MQTRDEKEKDSQRLQPWEKQIYSAGYQKDYIYDNRHAAIY